MMNITKSIEKGEAVFAVEGRLDTTTAPQLEEELKSSLDGISSLILNLEKLEYISSAGLRVLLSVQKIMNSKGSMKVTKVSKPIMEIFDVTGFSDILTIEL